MNRINQLFQHNPHNLLSIYFCAGCPALKVLPTSSVHSKKTVST